MYTPAHFAEDDLALLDALAWRYPFATVITLCEGAPFVSHLPVLYHRDAEAIELRGHWARANPQWRHGGVATVILRGPDAYVSPTWYPDKETAARVPTWNYALAQLAGTLEIVQDQAGLAKIVSALSDRHEADAGSAWKFDLGREDMRSQLRGIVGFRLRPTRVELKFKLSQNHPETNVRSVAARLAHGSGQAADLSALMLEQLNRYPAKESP